MLIQCTKKLLNQLKVDTFPVCIDGRGKTPPEDVGGENGYERFLKIIKDREHKQYEEMINWGKRQGYSEFDIKKINKRLK